MGFSAAYRAFVATHPDARLWHDPDFCEALAPPRWYAAYEDVLLTDAAGEVLAVVPVFRKWRPWGSVLSVPTFGRYADPLTRDGGAAGVGQAVAVLAKAFASCVAADHFLSPEATTRLLPDLQERLPGLEYRARTTYRIPVDGTPEEVKRRAGKSKRKQLRRAGQYWTYAAGGLTPEVLDVLEATFRRQGMMVPYERATLQHLAVALAPDERLLVGCARHPDGRIGAAEVAVGDAHETYSLISGASDDARKQAGGSFVLAQDIDWTHERGRARLDYLGSDLEGPAKNRAELGGVRAMYTQLRLR